MPGHDEGTAHEWQPQEGFQRTALTTLASAMAGAGYAILLAGVSLLAGVPSSIPITVVPRASRLLCEPYS